MYSTRNIKFISKAETLQEFKKLELKCTIPEFCFFSHSRWLDDRNGVVEEICRLLASNLVAVRSSALCEDGASSSYAGAFKSILNIDLLKKKQLVESIESVFSSFSEQNPLDQVLIQKMVTGIDVSGVIMTRCVDDGSPYYVLNYDDESGNSDSITGGKGVHKTVLVYRKYRAEYCDSYRIRKMLELASEVEKVCGQIPLDIEFALDNKGVMHLLQVRRISTVGGWHPDAEHRVSRVIPHAEKFVETLSARRKGLFGDTTILGNMPDWNPAELIGAIPSPLAASLFRLLISSYAWSEARARMGYRRFPRTELMVMICGRIYIDVRSSFNSFLPEELPEAIGEKLVNAWLDRLAANPSLHDKVEFEVAHTVLDFAFDENFSSRYSNLLTAAEKNIFKELLRVFTNNALDLSDQGSLPCSLSMIDGLCRRQDAGSLNFETDSPHALAAHISGLLQECLQSGTIPFTIIARHGFIAETILRSAVARKAITSERISQFKASFQTIMSDLAVDTLAVCKGTLDEQAFQARYGHLRPGTFDILSPCYRDRPDLFADCLRVGPDLEPEPFILTSKESRAINNLLGESGITSVDAAGLFEYSRLAIQGREYAKFIFTRNLSAALECIATWGNFYNLGREDLSHLSINDILDTAYRSDQGETTSLLMRQVDQARIDQSLARVFKLSYLVRGVRDIHVVPVHRSEPNFITNKKVEATAKFLKATSVNYGSLQNSIVCIENADPGYDWIFTKGLAGLITKYGGANSHMAIRCAELQLPAAIGCGEELFARLSGARKIELDCSTKMIRLLSLHV